MTKARIYTRTGDNGTTSLAGGMRVAKNCQRVEAYGTLDELNAHLGMLAVAIEDEHTAGIIEKIESQIMSIGSILATDNSNTAIDKKHICMLEKEIDTLEATLPPLNSFIMPGGNEAAARTNLCRTVCRRAEREIVTLGEETHIDSNIIAYINRLSDYLFLLQRQLLGCAEKKWENPCR